MGEYPSEYRTQLLALEEKAQAAYDGTVLALSGGALGVSFAFVTNFLDRASMQVPGWLLGAWGAWTVSVTLMLVSHLAGLFAIRRAIKEVDQKRRVTLRYDWMTVALNITAGVLFVVGVLSITYFVWRNSMVNSESYETAVVPDHDTQKHGYRVPPPPPPQERATQQGQTQQGQQSEAPKKE